LTGVFAGVFGFVALKRNGISRFAFGFTPAFGRAERRFAAGFRREAEASLYLAATATTEQQQQIQNNCRGSSPSTNSGSE
jgi:hypothetical protein